MNEFKFACPNCQQKLEATPEYAGMQINCPSCQSPIVVPQPAEAAGAPPRRTSLSKAPSTVQHAATSPVMAATTIRRTKKPRVGLYVGLGVGAVVAVAAVIATPKIINKYHEHQAQIAADKAAADAAEFARTNVPPEPSADEIVKKMGSAYKELTSFSARGQTEGTLDMSQVMPGNPMFKEPMHLTTTFSVLLGRGGHYRIEWEQQVQPRPVKGAVWSAGKGDFSRVGAGAPRKVKNWEMALDAADASGAFAPDIARLFFDATNSLAVEFKNYSKTKKETVNGHQCYVLSGEASAKGLIGHIELWIQKDRFLIEQAELKLDGQIDETALAGMSSTQKAQVRQASKIKGDFKETYSDIQTDQELADADFQPGAKVAGNGQPRHKKREQAGGNNADGNQGGQRKSEGVAGLAPE